MSAPIKNSHCSYCGHRFDQESWPRLCGGCGMTSWINPIPVAVVLVPILRSPSSHRLGNGLLIAQRNIEPRRGEFALPGGFMEMGETWQEAGVREVREELDLHLSPEDLTLFHAGNTPHGQLLVFMTSVPIQSWMLDEFKPNEETQAIDVIRDPRELAFPLHTEAAARWLRTQERWLNT